MERDPKYIALLKEYPQEVTKEQFYQIAHISKKTALYLLQSGLVPCSDSGKKTRRYKIKITDIIIYLKNREINPLRYKRPRDGNQPNVRLPHHTYQDLMDQLDCDLDSLVGHLTQYYKKKLAQYPDVLTTKEIAAITGYSKQSVQHWIKKGALKSFPNGQQYFIPQPWLLEFLSNQTFWLILNKSQEQIADFEKVVGQNNVSK